MPVPRKSPAPTLQRGMAILEYLATHQHSATIAELSERLGYPSASVFRITQAFTELGYLSRDPVTRQFRLTNKLLLLGQPHSRGPGLVEASIAAMRELNRVTGETTQLCCLVDTGVVVLEQLLALHAFKYSAELGARCPAYSCAPGKAILAHLPDDERDHLIRRIRFKRVTPTTITDRRLFREERAAIRNCGFAVDRSEGMAGIHCVAAAICDRNGIPVGAITIAAPASRVKEEDFAGVGQLVIRATRTAQTNYGQ